MRQTNLQSQLRTRSGRSHCQTLDLPNSNPMLCIQRKSEGMTHGCLSEANGQISSPTGFLPTIMETRSWALRIIPIRTRDSVSTSVRSPIHLGLPVLQDILTQA